MMWGNIIFKPAALILLLWLALRFMKRRKRRQIKEMFDE